MSCPQWSVRCVNRPLVAVSFEAVIAARTLIGPDVFGAGLNGWWAAGLNGWWAADRSRFHRQTP